MDITLRQISDWLDSFYASYIEAKVPIRGRTFSGLKIEIYEENMIAVVVTDPYLRGTTEVEKSFDFVRSIHDANRTLTAELDKNKLISLINGTYQLSDSDWVWDDE